MNVRVKQIDQVEFSKNSRGNWVSDYLQGHLDNNSAFNTAFVKVLPGEKTKAHEHVERENFIILQGEGCLTVDGVKQEIREGMSLYIPSYVNHEIFNTSDKELLLQTIYWQPGLARDICKSPETQIALVCAFPTPNGPLHLGHMAGPYLAFDVYYRFLSNNKFALSSQIGFDCQQGQMIHGSEQASIPISDFLDQNRRNIQLGFDRCDLQCDYWLDTMDDEYCEEVRQTIQSAISQNLFVKQPFYELFCPSCNRFCTSTEFNAGCSNCSNEINTNECETCFRYTPNQALIGPSCCRCNTLLNLKCCERLVFPLSKYQHLLQHGESTSEFVRDYYSSVCSQDLPDLPVFHQSNFGVVVTDDNQHLRVSCWVENVARISRVLAGHDMSKPIELVRLFGNDNAFLYAVICSILTTVFFPTYTVNHTFQANYFYMLNGKKFSTSEQHAIWVNDFISENNSDAVRLYFMLNRSDKSSVDYVPSEFKSFQHNVFSGKIIQTLTKLLSQFGKLKEQRIDISIGDETDYQALYQLGTYCYQKLSEFEVKYYARSLDIYIELISDMLKNHENRYDLISYGLYFFTIVYTPLLPKTTKKLLDSLGLKQYSLTQMPWYDSLLPRSEAFNQFLRKAHLTKEELIYENSTFY